MSTQNNPTYYQRPIQHQTQSYTDLNVINNLSSTIQISITRLVETKERGDIVNSITRLVETKERGDIVNFNIKYWLQFQIGISQNIKCDNLVGFAKSGHKLWRILYITNQSIYFFSHIIASSTQIFHHGSS